MTQNLSDDLIKLHQEILTKGFAYRDRMFIDQARHFDLRAQKIDQLTHYTHTNTQVLYKQSEIQEGDRFVASSFRHLHSATVQYLDVGCADGVRTARLLKMLRASYTVDDVMAVDISPGMIEEAKTHLGETHAACMNVLDLPYQNRFSLITMVFGTLGHLDEADIPVALGRLYNAMKPGGLLVFDVLGFVPEIAQSWGYTEHVPGKPNRYMAYYVGYQIDKLVTDGELPTIGMVRLCDQDELTRWIHEAGFELIEIQELSSRDPNFDYGMDYGVIARRRAE